MQSDRERLDERGFAKAHPLGHVKRVLGLHADELGVGAGNCTETDAANLHADHAVAAPAAVALPAREVGEGYRAIADRPAADSVAYGGDLTGELVAEDGSRRHRVDRVQIRSADPAIAHAQQQLARLNRRRLDVLDCQRARSL